MIRLVLTMLAMVAALASGCVSSAGTHVRDVWISGDTLIVERCEVYLMGRLLSERGCHRDRVPLRHVTGPGATTPNLQVPPRPGSSENCAPLIREWRAETDARKKSQLIIKMPEVCRDPKLLYE